VNPKPNTTTGRGREISKRWEAEQMRGEKRREGLKRGDGERK